MSSSLLPDLGELLKKLIRKLHDWVEAFTVMLPNLLVAALTLTAGVLIARVVQRVVYSMLRGLAHNDTIARLVASLCRIGIIALSCLWALSLLHLDKAVTSVLAGVGVVGLALGFAFQDIAANFMSGFIMALYRPFAVGDLIEVSGRECRVKRIDLRATEVETLDGLSIIMPNKDIFQNPIVNYTRTSNRRMDLTMGAAYGDDMEHVRAVVVAAVEGVPARDGLRDIEVFFESFGDSSINFTLRIWLTDSRQLAYLQARSEAMIAIKKAFDREGITIPFPIRTLDFGADAVGGVQLDRVKLQTARAAE